MAFYILARESLYNNSNINNNTLLTHATSRSGKNSLKHVRETKNVKKKSNNLKLPLLNLSKTLLLQKTFKSTNIFFYESQMGSNIISCPY